MQMQLSCVEEEANVSVTEPANTEQDAIVMKQQILKSEKVSQLIQCTHIL